MTRSGAFLAACALATGCKWTVFDDLEDQAWVHATVKPENDSTNWGIAVQRGQRLSSGDGKVAVIGATVPLYNELTYRANGETSVTSALELGDLGIVSLPAAPIVLADPVTDDIAILAPSGSAGVAVLRGGAGSFTVHQVFGGGLDRADAGTYMTPPDLAGAAPAKSQPLLAKDDMVFGTFVDGPPNPQPSCKLVDGGNAPVLVRGMAAVRPTGGMTDDVLVWSSTGKLLRYPSIIFNGAAGTLPMNAMCPTGFPPLATAAMDTTLKPASGARVMVFEANGSQFGVLAGFSEGTGTEGFLGLYDLATMMPVGTPRSDARLRSAELMELGGKRYVVVGYPSEVVESTEAGLVRVFEVDPLTGVAAAPALTLHDAEPDENQSFGRAVTVMLHNGQPTIAVGADNEVFLYFRTNLYADTRSP